MEKDKSDSQDKSDLTVFVKKHKKGIKKLQLWVHSHARHHSLQDLSQENLPEEVLDTLPSPSVFSIAPSDMPSPTTSTASNGLMSPTDIGDSSDEEDEAAASCSGHEHEGFTALDDIFDMSIDNMFQVLFTDSQVYRDFVAARKTVDLVVPPWPDESDSTGIKCRVITYTLSLNYSIGPKTSPSTEKQIWLLPLCRPNVQYIVDTEVINSGVPYSDNFYVVSRYCITKVTSRKCRLQVRCQVKYRKSCWGLVKNFIDKNATAGILEAFSSLGQFLHNSITTGAISRAASDPGKKRSKRMRSKDRQTSFKAAAQGFGSEDAMFMSGSVKRPKSKEELYFGISPATLVRIVCVILISLVFLNSILFYKLWTLEQFIDDHYPRPLPPTRLPHVGDLPKTAEGWHHILEHQRLLQDTEIERWNQVVSSSITLLDRMKDSLLGLQSVLQTLHEHTSKS